MAINNGYTLDVSVNTPQEFTTLTLYYCYTHEHCITGVIGLFTSSLY